MIYQQYPGKRGEASWGKVLLSSRINLPIELFFSISMLISVCSPQQHVIRQLYIIYIIYKQHYNQRVVLYNIHNINNIILIDCIPNSFSQDRSHSPKNNLLSPNLDLLSTQVVCLHVWLPTQFFRPKRVCQNHRKTSDRTGVNPFSWTFAWWLFKQ